jgi:hypothetical protein
VSKDVLLGTAPVKNMSDGASELHEAGDLIRASVNFHSVPS